MQESLLSQLCGAWGVYLHRQRDEKTFDARLLSSHAQLDAPWLSVEPSWCSVAAGLLTTMWKMARSGKPEQMNRSGEMNRAMAASTECLLGPNE